MNQLDAHEIIPQLWQGSRPRAGREVAEAGFDVLVLCAREHQPAPDAYPGILVILAPNDDHHFVTREDLQVAVRTASRVVAYLQQGKKVLVTCLAGINRSGLVVALTIHKFLGFSGKSCIDIVREKRRFADVGDEALTNTFFVEALLKLPGTDVVVPRSFRVTDHRAGSSD